MKLLRLKYSITMVEMIAEVEKLVAKGLGYLHAIPTVVNAIEIGEYETIGEAYSCRNILVRNLTRELEEADPENPRRFIGKQLMNCPECDHPHQFDRAIERGVNENRELILGVCPNCGTNHTEIETCFRANDTYQFPNFIVDEKDQEKLGDLYSEYPE